MHGRMHNSVHKAVSVLSSFSEQTNLNSIFRFPSKCGGTFEGDLLKI